MIVDESALDVADAAFDVVVVGTGPAGLAVADRLEAAGLRILVLEAGGSRQGAADRRELRGEVVQGSPQPRLDLYRTRALGGTSRIWGGRCIPLDAIDYERRDWVAGSGWPIGRDEVDAHRAEATAFLEAGTFEDDPSLALPGQQAELVEGLDGPDLATTLERFSKPTDVWRAHGGALERSHRAWIVERVQVTGIALDPSDASLVDGLDVVGPSGRRKRVRARHHVVAAGGLETPRLLLASDDVEAGGVGNARDQVGRRYMSHLCLSAGTLTIAPGRGAMCGYHRDADGIYVRRRLWVTEAAQRRLRLLNATFRTIIPDPADPRHADPVLSAMFLAKSMVQPEYAARFKDGPVGFPGYLAHLANIGTGIVPLTAFARGWTRDRILAERKLPSVVRDPTDGRHGIEIHCEQSPEPSSRVTLGWQRDSLGMRRMRVEWRVADDDVRAVRRAYRLLADGLEATRSGRLQVDLDALEERTRTKAIAGGHHIGTVRMSAGPADGVVDADCRVHGKRNLWLAGSGVMPTSGQANPTLTLTCLALRLAGRLSREIADDARPATLTPATIETAVAARGPVMEEVP